MGFSLEGQVMNEIELLFMRIFGRLELITSISAHVKTTELKEDDVGWVDEIKKNMEYNSCLLGASVWDLVCKWNHDIYMVKSWMARYTNDEMKKYSTDL